MCQLCATLTIRESTPCRCDGRTAKMPPHRGAKRRGKPENRGAGVD
ncbi:hypothetical protein HMPREF0576_1401 [Mobiluncus holmesii ATCC 35242]|uniref:Uncharacterized protein n=1 Tax=Mobiluncus holmesii ATCC 35242 TaxID=887899 RepID=E6M511_9ACTO|nr:hypothetical protein HMPREF0576_1401 [Mobiluncus holmesii ATCC 35242]